MQEQQSATLRTIFSEVLANLAFMFDDDELAEVTSGEQWLETEISYEGPSRGALRLRCTREFAQLLAGNLLGIDPQDQEDDEVGEDAVKEFMNIVCGQLVTALHGTEDIFNLTIPEIRQLSETPDFDHDSALETISLSVESHRVELSYSPGNEI